MKISAVLKGAEDSQGRQRLYIRLSDGQKRLFIKTELRFRGDDFKKGKVLPHHPNHELLNKEVRRLMVRQEAELHGLFEKDELNDRLECIHKLSNI